MNVFVRGLGAMLLALFMVTGSAQSQGPVKRVFLEQFTGAWCGWCVDGSVVIDNLLAQYPNQLIAVKVHQGDGMEIPKVMADTLRSFVAGYPSGAIDRMLFSGQQTVGIGRNLWSTYVRQQMAMTADVGIEITNVNFDPSTRKITADVTATFVKSASGDLRINLIVVEDNVTGTGATYDQKNFIANNPSFVGHPYYSKPATITGYKHRSVVRSYAGGVWGAKGIIPGVAQTGTPYTAKFSYTLPASYKADNITLVGTVQKFGTAANAKIMLNANEVGLTKAIVKTESSIEKPAMFVAQGSKGSTEITIKNLSSAAATVTLSVYAESSLIPDGWDATVEPSTISLPANGTAKANVTLNTDGNQGYAVIAIDAVSKDPSVIGRVSRGYAYSMTPGMKYAVYNAHPRMNENYAQPLRNRGGEFESKSIDLPLNAGFMEMYPASTFDAAIFAVHHNGRGSLGTNPAILAQISGMLDAGKKVFIAGGLEAYLGIKSTSATNATKSFFESRLGVTVTNEPVLRLQTSANGQITGTIPFQLQGVKDDVIGNGIDYLANDVTNLNAEPFLYYTDALSVNPGSKATPVLYMDENADNVAGIRWQEGNAKLVMFTFDMDGISDEEVKNTIMDRTYTWLFSNASSVEEDSDLSMLLQPNPFSGAATVQFMISDPSTQYVTFNLVDMLGRNVQTSMPVPVSTGMNSYMIKNNGLTPGAYRLVVTGSNGKTQTMPVMINR
ncbi:MAG: Omp28-related outer membrane protein [Ignavibacteria bacterium]|nr:Omp28-related outer membrane protein [Ignavibacteria bacterium]